MKNIKKMLWALALGLMFIGNAGAMKPRPKGGEITDYFHAVKIGTKKESDKESTPKLGAALQRTGHENINKTEFGLKLAGFIGGLGLSFYTGLDLSALILKIIMGTGCPVLADESMSQRSAIFKAIFEVVAFGCFGIISAVCFKDSNVSRYVKKYGCYAMLFVIGFASLWLMRLV